MRGRSRSRGTPPIGTPPRCPRTKSALSSARWRCAPRPVGHCLCDQALALPSAPGGGRASATAAWSGDTALAPVQARHSTFHFHVRDGTCIPTGHAEPLSLPQRAADRYSAEMSSHEAGALISALALSSAPCDGTASATAASSNGDTAPAPVHARHPGFHFYVRDWSCEACWRCPPRPVGTLPEHQWPGAATTPPGARACAAL